MLPAKISTWMATEPKVMKISSILKILYLPAGIFIYKKIETYSLPYLVTLYALFFCNTSGVVFTINDPKAQPLENLYFFSCGSIVMITLLIGRYRKNYLMDFYAEVKRYQKMERFVRLSDTIIRGRMRYVWMVILVLISLIIVVPMYALLFTDAKTDDFIVLIYPMWYPWKRDTMSKYLFSVTFQYVSILYGYYLLSFTLGSFVFATLFIYVRCTILKRDIVDMEDKAKDAISPTTTNYADELDERLKRRFVAIVNEHQMLLKFVRETISCFSLMATVLVIYTSMTMILLITLFLKSDVLMLLKVKLLSTSLVAVLALVTCCYCGEVILNVNSQLMNAVYNTPWYGYSIKIRKVIIMFMIQNQKQFQIKSFGMFLLCVSYIATAFRLLYSCIQVLRQRAN